MIEITRIATFLLIVTLSSAQNGCSLNLAAGLGCLNSYVYNLTSQFTCGPNVGSQPGIYDDVSTGCCAAGQPFDLSTGYCCYNGINPFQEGYECSPYDVNLPASCYNCATPEPSSTPAVAAGYGFLKGSERLIAENTIVPDQRILQTSSEPINTLDQTGSQGCTVATEENGCMNGYTYDYSTQTPCGSYLIPADTYGCCFGPGSADSVYYYLFASGTCCYNPFSETYMVYDTSRACTCTQQDCVPTPKPTPAPTEPPSPIPSAIPTPSPSAIPTLIPTPTPSTPPSPAPTNPTSVPSSSPSRPTNWPTSVPSSQPSTEQAANANSNGSSNPLTPTAVGLIAGSCVLVAAASFGAVYYYTAKAASASDAKTTLLNADDSSASRL